MPIVQAVGIAATKPNMSGAERNRAAQIEQAMSQAVLAANAEGITDPEIIRKRMLDARDRMVEKLDKGG